MSFWSRMVRAIDRLLGDPEPDYNGMDPDLVEEAVRLIQNQVDADRSGRTVRKLRVSDLSPERRQELAAQLAQLVKKRNEPATKTDASTTDGERDTA